VSSHSSPLNFFGLHAIFICSGAIGFRVSINRCLFPFAGHGPGPEARLGWAHPATQRFGSGKMPGGPWVVSIQVSLWRDDAAWDISFLGLTVPVCVMGVMASGLPRSGRGCLSLDSCQHCLAVALFPALSPGSICPGLGKPKRMTLETKPWRSGVRRGDWSGLTLLGDLSVLGIAEMGPEIP
jgi:hypothetical protein